jgi:hypothetical protein
LRAIMAPSMTKQGYGLGRGLTDYRSDDIDRFDIQDRFGAFLAIRWPEDGYAERYDIKFYRISFQRFFHIYTMMIHFLTPLE